MAKRILFLGLMIAASAFAHGAPGVWEKMQLEQITVVRGLVKSVDLGENGISFKVKTRDVFGDDSEVELHLCSPNVGGQSEEIRAALLKSKIDMLQEARRTGKSIEFGTGNPWVHCVSTLRALES
jgi:hypothetical protein